MNAIPFHLGLLLAFLLECSGQSAFAQPPIKSGDLDLPAAKPTGAAGADARALIEGLVNNNPAPKFVDDNPVFDPNFDWNEHRRVWKAIPVLVRHSQEAWPELVEHLEDGRYCATFESPSGNTIQCTVGGMCRLIIGRNLAAAYYLHLKPESVMMYSRYSIPSFAHVDGATLKKWCRERSNKQLYELQIEACELMIAELEREDDLKERIPKAKLEGWIADIRKQIDTLRESHKAVPFTGFGSEEYTQFSKESARIAGQK
jgi:hypothetical protein